MNKHKNFVDIKTINPIKENVRFSYGNSKIGKIVNLNLLPGEKPLTCSTGTLTNIPGTCNGCCDGCENFCYAIKAELRHNNVCVRSHAINTVIARNDIDDFFRKVDAKLSRMRNVKVFRYHTSGEIISYEYLLRMVNLAKKHKDVHFYFYTKRFGFIQKYLEEFGKFPSNLVCNISEWHGNTKGFDFSSLNKFVYCDGTEDVPENAKFCPAVDANGHKTGVTCEKCGLCWRKSNGHTTYVHKH